MKKAQAPFGVNLLLAGAVLITLGVWTSFFDPFIFPKFALLVLAGALAAGLLVVHFRRPLLIKPYFLLILMFISLLLMLVISSEVLNTSIFGVQGRNMGFLSYLSLAILSLLFVSVAGERVLRNSINAFQIAGGLVVLYGVLQAIGADPFEWRLVYEGIIGNLGNPNFMSVTGGLGGAVFLGGLVFNVGKTALKTAFALAVILSLVVIYFSKSTQGWIVFLIAGSPVIYVLLERLGKTLQRLFLGAFAGGVSLVGMALFNLGPLGRFIYEQSLEFRADFWRIAWSMASDNPVSGVGIDRYQNFYREYMTLEQIQRVGAEDFSDSAHNIYLHLAATGGFPLAVSLLLINLFVAYRFIVLLSSESKSKQQASVIFGIWLGIQAQNLISIEYPSIALWGWIFAGLGVGMSYSDQAKLSGKEELGRRYLGVAISIVGVGASLFVIAPAASAQSDLLKGFYAYVEKDDAEAMGIKSEFLKNMEKKDPGNPTLPILSANSLFQDEAFVEAAQAARRAIEIDDHDYRAWWFLASSLEESGNRVEAIPARLKTIELSPFNSPNLLELAKNYVAAKDVEGLRRVQLELQKLNPDSVESQEASKLEI